MPSILHLISHFVATLFVGFGVNAIVNPASALSFFEFVHPAGAGEVGLVNSLLAVYGVRDIFMGVAIYAAALAGTNKSLGLTMLAAGLVAAADGYVCFVHGAGEMNHWGYAPLLVVTGGLLLGK
ncbi:hypothetical protein OQA88_7412 [Cercophora sp. LCS_1]